MVLCMFGFLRGLSRDPVMVHQLYSLSNSLPPALFSGDTTGSAWPKDAMRNLLCMVRLHRCLTHLCLMQCCSAEQYAYVNLLQAAMRAVLGVVRYSQHSNPTSSADRNGN